MYQPSLKDLYSIGTKLRVIGVPSPMKIDINWAPRSFLEPDTRNSSLEISNGDVVEIISEAAWRDDLPSCLFKVRDSDKNEFWLSASFLDDGKFNGWRGVYDCVNSREELETALNNNYQTKLCPTCNGIGKLLSTEESK